MEPGDDSWRSFYPVSRPWGVLHLFQPMNDAPEGRLSVHIYPHSLVILIFFLFSWWVEVRPGVTYFGGCQQGYNGLSSCHIQLVHWCTSGLAGLQAILIVHAAMIRDYYSAKCWGLLRIAWFPQSCMEMSLRAEDLDCCSLQICIYSVHAGFPSTWNS